MNNRFLLLLALSFMHIYSDLWGQNPNAPGTQEPHPNQYFVKLCHGVSNKEANALMSELNSVQLWENKKIGLRLWAVKQLPYSCSDGDITDINEHLVRSKRKTNIDDAMLNMVFTLEGNDFGNGNSNFDNLNLNGALGSTPVRIAILDSGISDAAIAASADYSGPVVYTGYDYVDDDPVPDDQNGHGTHIAGVIYDIVSRISTPSNITFDIRKTHDEDGFGDISNLISAIVDAVDAGANVINMSFSYYEIFDSEELNPLQVAIEYAEQKGVLVVASAGNKYQNNDAPGAVPVPANLPNENIISVASNRSDESLSSFSNYGSNSVDVSILGESIPGPGLNGNRAYGSGTSLSTAIVTALSAILGTRQDQFNSCEIKCTLINTSKNVPAMQGLNQANGVINFQNALQSTPSQCQQACPDIDPTVVMSCGANCPPETNDMNLCVPAEVTVVDQLLVYDVEEDVITFTPTPVYGPFRGTVAIYPDGTFSYTSFSGQPDLFVYQVCDDKQEACSDGCNQGVVYINTAGCNPPSNNGNYIYTGQDCVMATNDEPKLLTFRYTGQDCSATNHAQDPGKVSCYGNPAFAPVVYVTALGSKAYFTDREVPLNGTFSIDAASVGDQKLKSSTEILLKNAAGQLLQVVEFNTSGSQPLRVQDQFGGLVLEGYLSEVNLPCGDPDLENRDIYDCVVETGEVPKLLTFRYTGEGCSAMDHDQDPGKVICSGDPGFAPTVYVTAIGDADKYYLINQEVSVDGTFSVDAASAGEDKLKNNTTILLKNAAGQILETVVLHTSGSQPLGRKDLFGGLVLEGYLSKDDVTCGNPEVENRNILDCDKETGESPRLLTFRYTGEGCGAMDHNQDPGKVQCSGDPGFAGEVYVTAIGGSDKYYLINRAVSLDGTFSVDAARVGENKLKNTTTIYLKDADGQILQTVMLETSGSQPLGLNDQYASLRLAGYLGEHGGICGKPRIPTALGDCCDYTGKKPRILTLQYTGDGCNVTTHNQEPGKVYCSGDPGYASFVYVSAESVDGNKREVVFTDLPVPLNGIFDVDATSIGENKFKKDLVFYLKDAQGNLLQEVKFRASCSEPLGEGNQFGALSLKGYVAENGDICGDMPVSQACDPTSGCTTTGKRSAIGLMYLGATETAVAAYSKSVGQEFIGSYLNVGPGDFIVFSSLYRNAGSMGHFFLQWAGGQSVEIPVETSVDILGNVYGDFMVVQQLDQEFNDCRIAFSGCSEVNRQCGEPVLADSQQETSNPVEPTPPDRFALQAFPEKDVILYPNPARQVVYLGLEDYAGETLDIALYDSVSRQLKRIRVAEAAPLQEVSLAEIPNGVYYVIIQPEEGRPVSKKLVVARN
ncbi:MAG: S8 family serine peptidase [Lewinellaceae bacterium]|nr:S8 family serine peptidase [Lewinellaceae bacterium]